MKNTFWVLALGAAFAASATFAHASQIPVGSELSVTGPSVFNYNSTNPSLSFVYFPSYCTTSCNSSYVFQGVDPYVTNGAQGGAFAPIGTLTPLNWMLIGNVPLGSQASHMPPTGPLTVFTGPDGLSFTLTQEGWTEATAVIGSQTYDDLTVNGMGYFTLNGYDQTNGTFNFTIQQPVDGNGNPIACPTSASTSPSSCAAIVTADFSGSGLTSPVPEPSSLALLGTGLLGAAAIARRRLSARLSA